ncbi:MAG: hypothetical protein AB7Q00_12705 [Phycisphaerales bacterium]
MTEPHPFTNADRVKRFTDTLAAYNDEYDLDSNLIDLLADARHWCDAHGHAFAEFDRTAYQHYLAERREEVRP